MRSYWYQNFEDPTIHVTVATDAKFWGLKFQNRFTHAKLRGRDLIFRYYPIFRTCSFTWPGQNKISATPCKFPVLFRPSTNGARLETSVLFLWIFMGHSNFYRTVSSSAEGRILQNDFRFEYPNRFNPSIIKPMPNNEPVDILCHNSVGNKNMKSGKFFFYFGTCNMF